MLTLALDADLLPRVVQALGQSPLFAAISPDVLQRVAERGTLLQLEPGETLVSEGTDSDTFAVLLLGELCVLVGPEQVEITKIHPPESVGEMGLLLGQKRTATVTTSARSLLLRFDREAFNVMYERIQGFGMGIARALATRMATASRQIPMPELADAPDPEVASMLPVEFLSRHRVLPMRQEGNRVLLGFVDDPSARVVQLARELLPGMEVVPVRIKGAVFDDALGAHAGVPGWTADPLRDSASTSPSDDVAAKKSSPRLDALLRRMVAEGCSDLHLSGGQRPRWRIDGEMKEIADASILGPSEVRELLLPIMDERATKGFDDDNDVDFAYAIHGVARFRVNVFRDKGGVGSVMRQIPAKILTFEQLNLPPVVARMCDQPKGLVLVTGPTGSGKSTTLAAMVNHINASESVHILTVEDPIEFLHRNIRASISQREIGVDTGDFGSALRSALRQDPDVILVGEMRDHETVDIALKAAETGHLVLSTVHTTDAVKTIGRLLSFFPGDEQQITRQRIAETLKGTISQRLLPKAEGGQAMAMEIMVQTKTVQEFITDASRTSSLKDVIEKGRTTYGMQSFDQHLAELYKTGVIAIDTARAAASNPADFERSLNFE